MFCGAQDIKKDINALEAVQRRATKLLPETKDLPYYERRLYLNLPTLSYRSKGAKISNRYNQEPHLTQDTNRGDMIQVFKLIGDFSHKRT